MDRKEYIKNTLLLSDTEVEQILCNKKGDDIFAVYMVTVNFYDYGYHIFLEHGMNMHTKLSNNRDVSDCKCLYDVLLRTPFRHREDGSLFRFITNALITNRNLREGELL